MSSAETDTYSAQDAPEFAPAQFVRWFREVAPYVHDFRGKTFVVAFGGELIEDGGLEDLVADLSLLSALGIKLVLVHGSRPQVNEQLRLKGHATQFGRGTEPTSPEASLGAERSQAPKYVVVLQDDVRDVRGVSAEIARGNGFGLEKVRLRAARGFTAM